MVCGGNRSICLPIVRELLAHDWRVSVTDAYVTYSVDPVRAYPFDANDALSKAAVLSLVHSIRHCGTDSHVRCTALCPSFEATDMAASLTPEQSARSRSLKIWRTSCRSCQPPPASRRSRLTGTTNLNKEPKPP